LKEQKDEYLFFGEALVQLRILSTEKVMEKLKEFNKIKIKETK